MNNLFSSLVRAVMPRHRRSGSDVLGYYLGDSLEDLSVSGYTSLLQSPDVAAVVGAVASIVGSSTICLMRNTPQGDVRVRDRLSRFMDIHPYSLGTRKSLIEWIIVTMLTTGNGNAFVLPVTEGGMLADLIPMPTATVSSNGDDDYLVQWKGRTYAPDEVLHFVYNVDPFQPWLGRGVRVQLKDILQNLKQAAATTNNFMSKKWKPSIVIKVDGVADEISTEEGRRNLLKSYVSSDNAGEPWIIPADLMDVQTIKPLSLADLAISDSVQLDRRSVAAAFGVPAFLLGLGEYKQDEYNGFIRRTIIPLATGIAQELTKKLLTSEEMYFKFSTRRLYSYSLTELAQVGDDQFIRGIMTGNEVRDWLDLSPKSGLDELVILENYIPQGMIGAQKKLKGDNNDE